MAVLGTAAWWCDVWFGRTGTTEAYYKLIHSYSIVAGIPCSEPYFWFLLHSRALSVLVTVHPFRYVTSHHSRLSSYLGCWIIWLSLSCFSCAEQLALLTTTHAASSEDSVFLGYDAASLSKRCVGCVDVEVFTHLSCITSHNNGTASNRSCYPTTRLVCMTGPLGLGEGEVVGKLWPPLTFVKT